MTGSLGELLAAAGVLITAVTGLLALLLVDLRKVRSEVAGITTQVRNSHPTNLRDDIDRLALNQDQMLRSMQRVEQAQNDLADDLRVERVARERLDADAHQTHRDLFGHIRRIDNIIKRRPKR